MLIFFRNSSRVFGIVLSFLSNTGVRLVLDRKYPFNAGVPQGSILGPTTSFLMM